MNKNLVWIVGSIQVLIILIVTVKIINNRNEITQLKGELDDSKSMLINRTKSKRIVSPKIKAPPPGKTFEGGGHWHGDEWHDSPHINITSPETLSASSLLKNIDTGNRSDDIDIRSSGKTALSQNSLLNLSDEQKEEYIESTTKMYSRHRSAEVRRYAELFPKFIMGERMTLEETYDFLKGGMIINPNESTLRSLTELEKRMNR